MILRIFPVSFADVRYKVRSTRTSRSCFELLVAMPGSRFRVVMLGVLMPSGAERAVCPQVPRWFARWFGGHGGTEEAGDGRLVMEAVSCEIRCMQCDGCTRVAELVRVSRKEPKTEIPQGKRSIFHVFEE